MGRGYPGSAGGPTGRYLKRSSLLRIRRVELRYRANADRGRRLDGLQPDSRFRVRGARGANRHISSGGTDTMPLPDDPQLIRNLEIIEAQAIVDLLNAAPHDLQLQLGVAV